MKVRVLVFGVLKNWIGSAETAVELSEGATVSGLLEKLAEGRPALTLRGIAVSINAEFASPQSALSDGDEVGLLPPVSGGCAEKPAVRVELVRAVIDAHTVVEAAKDNADGALLVFDGVVRNQTKGRPTLYLDYEAYEAMAIKQMESMSRQAIEQFGVRHVSIVHRLGKLDLGESSVLIVVASAHRGAAYEASRFLIETLKKQVPIWKKEVFVDGAEWRDGEAFPEAIAIDPRQAAK